MSPCDSDVSVDVLSNWIQVAAIVVALAVAVGGWRYDSKQRRRADARQELSEARAQAWRVTWRMRLEDQYEGPREDGLDHNNSRSLLVLKNGSDRPILDLEIRSALWRSDSGEVMTWLPHPDGDVWRISRLTPGQTTTRLGHWRNRKGEPAYVPTHRLDEVDVSISWVDPEGHRFPER